MVYVEYSERAQSLEFVPWYDARELAAAIKNIRKINFSIVEQRQQALERLANLSDDAPFDSQTRFPVGGYFICEAYGDWARKFQQLRSALSFKPGDKDEKRVGEKGVGGSSADQNDSQQAFFNSTTAFLGQIGRCDDVFNRKTFEVMFRCKWEESTQPASQ